MTKILILIVALVLPTTALATQKSRYPQLDEHVLATANKVISVVPVVRFFGDVRLVVDVSGADIAKTDGYTITITTTFLKNIEGTDELAFILAHELAHIYDIRVNSKFIPSKAREKYADLQALKYMKKAGYDVCKAPNRFKRLMKKYGDSKGITHPKLSERIRYLSCK